MYFHVSCHINSVFMGSELNFLLVIKRLEQGGFGGKVIKENQPYELFGILQ